MSLVHVMCRSIVVRRQAGGLPAGALESAFERARSHLAITTDDYDHYEHS